MALEELLFPEVCPPSHWGPATRCGQEAQQEGALEAEECPAAPVRPWPLGATVRPDPSLCVSFLMSNTKGNILFKEKTSLQQTTTKASKGSGWRAQPVLSGASGLLCAAQTALLDSGQAGGVVSVC